MIPIQAVYRYITGHQDGALLITIEHSINWHRTRPDQQPLLHPDTAPSHATPTFQGLRSTDVKLHTPPDEHLQIPQNWRFLEV